MGNMVRLQILLTTIFLVISSSLALADGSVTFTNGPFGQDALSTQSGKVEGSKTKGEKLEILESKLEELETRMNKLFSNSPLQAQGLNLEHNPYDSNTIQSMQRWSAEDHLLKAKTNHQKSEVLEGKIQNLQNQIDRLSKKPYLDTKGFKRDSLNRWKGNLVQELREATTKTAWHRVQAEKIMISESKHQQNS